MMIPINRGTVEPVATPTPYQHLEALPEDFGAQWGPAVSRLGETLQNTANTVISRLADNATRVNVAAAKDYFANVWLPKTKALTEPFYGSQGPHAIAGTPDLLNKLLDLRDQGIAQMQNPTQQTVFQGLADPHLDWELGAIDAHAQHQERLYSSQANDSLLNTLVNEAATNAGDSQRVGLLKHTSSQISGAFDQSRGLPPEEIRARQIDLLSRTESGVVNQLAASDPNTAQAYWNPRCGQRRKRESR